MQKILVVHLTPQTIREKFEKGFEGYNVIHLEEDLSLPSSITAILEEVRIHKPELVLVGIPEISTEVKKNLKKLRNSLYKKRITATFILPDHLTLEEIVMFTHETGIDTLIDEEYEGPTLLTFSLMYKNIADEEMAQQDLGLRP